MKEQIKNGWKKVKEWVVNHKKIVILGSAAVVVGAIGVVVNAARKESLSHEEEGQKILEALEASLENECDDEDVFKDVDRYVIDRDLIDKLPPGTYDVFDGYENQRVDYVVKGEESMET